MPESSFLIGYYVCGLLHDRAQGLGQYIGVITKVIPITFFYTCKRSAKAVWCCVFPHLHFSGKSINHQAPPTYPSCTASPLLMQDHITEIVYSHTKLLSSALLSTSSIDSSTDLPSVPHSPLNACTWRSLGR